MSLSEIGSSSTELLNTVSTTLPVVTCEPKTISDWLWFSGWRKDKRSPKHRCRRFLSLEDLYVATSIPSSNSEDVYLSIRSDMGIAFPAVKISSSTSSLTLQNALLNSPFHQLLLYNSAPPA